MADRDAALCDLRARLATGDVASTETSALAARALRDGVLRVLDPWLGAVRSLDDPVVARAFEPVILRGAAQIIESAAGVMREQADKVEAGHRVG